MLKQAINWANAFDLKSEPIQKELANQNIHLVRLINKKKSFSEFPEKIRSNHFVWQRKTVISYLVETNIGIVTIIHECLNGKNKVRIEKNNAKKLS